VRIIDSGTAFEQSSSPTRPRDVPDAAAARHVIAAAARDVMGARDAISEEELAGIYVYTKAHVL